MIRVLTFRLQAACEKPKGNAYICTKGTDPTEAVRKITGVMVLQILLIISVVLQLAAAVTAIRLTRVTKYNSSWMLFTAALVAMAVARLGEYYQLVGDKELRLPPDFFVWLGVVTSFCFAAGVFLVKKIFNYIDKLDFQRKLTERRILTTVLRTEEKERLHFSKELHDGLGPLLSSAKMSLSAIDRTTLPEADREIIRNTGHVIEEAIRSLREISNNLSPHILQDFGLVRAVSNFINKSQAINSAVQFDFSTGLRAERFDTDVEVILYRVICELINNSLKHAEAKRIDLSLHLGGDTLTLTYSDDGRGFEPDAVMDTGMGLSNIHSRINSLKGTVSIISTRNGGMQAVVQVKAFRDHGEKHRKI